MSQWDEFAEDISDRISPLRSEINAGRAPTVFGHRVVGTGAGPDVDQHHRDAPLHEALNPPFQFNWGRHILRRNG
jgi:hypothetical protein